MKVLVACEEARKYAKPARRSDNLNGLLMLGIYPHQKGQELEVRRFQESREQWPISGDEPQERR